MSSVLYGQVFQIPKRANTSGASSNPSPSSNANSVQLGGFLYFVATGSDGVNQIWRTDGTSAGTTQVTALVQGVLSSNSEILRRLVVMNGVIYFAGNDGSNGAELWRTDGTTAGTYMVANINVNSGANSNPNAFFVFNNTLYFQATSTNFFQDTELYKSDGTAAGTVLVKNINTTANQGSSPQAFFVYNNELYFRATDAANGAELWKTDGTDAGTVLVKDINPGSAGSSFTPVTEFNGRYLLFASTTANGNELWQTDGTSAGTVLVKDIAPGTANGKSFSGIVFNGYYYFMANDGVNGNELWRTDGTEAGTQLFYDANTSPNQGSSATASFYTFNNLLFFVADDGSAGVEIWRTDGTTTNTFLVKDIYTGSASSFPLYLLDWGGNLYFRARNDENNYELWKTDGTSSGTVLVKDIFPGNANGGLAFLNLFTIFNNQIYFAANDGVVGTELWKTDGSNAGTSLVQDIRTGLAGSSVPGSISSSLGQNLAVFNGNIYYQANDGVNGSELWRTDGTSAGTFLLKNISALGGSAPGSFYQMGNSLYFIAFESGEGFELYKTDGTEAGTVRVKNINPTINQSGFSSNQVRFAHIGSTLFFVANDGVSGTELWKSDGTEAGTVLVKDINLGSQNGVLSNNSLLVVNGSHVYFPATTSASGTELWRSDGTEAGTQMVTDLVPGSSSPNISSMVAMNGFVYFNGLNSSNNHIELWRTDGTTTHRVIDLGTATNDNIGNLCVFRNDLYFTGNNGNGIELWRLPNGDPSATPELFDINTTTSLASSNPGSLTVGGDWLYFTASNGTNGVELWAFNGTGSPEMVRDIRGGTNNSSSPQNLSVVNDVLYFSADDGVVGRELWRAQGLICSRFMQDIRPGLVASNPSVVVGTNDKIFLSAWDAQNSGSVAELFVANISDVNKTKEWSGTQSNAWIAQNFCGGVLPQNDDNLILLQKAVNKTAVMSSPLRLNNIWIENGLTLRNDQNSLLRVTGDILTTGRLEGADENAGILFEGTSPQLIDAVIETGTVTVNNAAGVTISNIEVGQIGVLNELVVSSGVLNTNGRLIIRSNSSRTGRIAQASGSYINGNVTAERFIPAKRAFRMLTPGVTTTDFILNNWQSSFGESSGVGTHITGSTTGANGFDQTITGNPSMFIYNPTTNAFDPIANTNATNLQAGRSYLLNVRGDRTIDLTAVPNPTPTPTILRARGSILMGQQVFNTSSLIPLQSGINAYSMIGNPYLSSIDWDALLKTGLSNTYWIWDPTRGVNGAWRSYTTGAGSNGDGDVSNVIRSGKAFFVQTTGASPSLTIEESHKVALSDNATFSDPNVALPKSVRVLLYRKELLDSNNASDGFAVYYGDRFKNEIGIDDAAKMVNPDENIAIRRGQQLLGLEAKHTLQHADTISVDLWNLTQANYVVRVQHQGFDDTDVVYWIDKRSGKKVNVLTFPVYQSDIETNGSQSLNDLYQVVVEKKKAIVDVPSSLQLSVYPNPASDQLLVNYQLKEEESVYVRLVDMQGGLLQQHQLGKQARGQIRLNLNGLSKGQYIVEVASKNGKMSKQFIKQ
jgi:ELWxxDGT repeat protein